MLVHDDRFGRVAIARHLLHAQCDVIVVDTFSALAAADHSFPPVAIVRLAMSYVEHLLQGMLRRSPELRVVAILRMPTARQRSNCWRRRACSTISLHRQMRGLPTSSRSHDGWRPGET